jgi:hypothetical protein
MPRKQPPEGFITAGEATKMLQVTDAMLTRYVQQGRLKRYGPEERKHKFYKLSEVQAIIDADNAFFKVEEETVPPSTFRLATSQDLSECGELIEAVFHVKSNLARRAEWLAKNPETGFILRDSQDHLVGCAFVLPLLPEKIEEILNTEITPPIRADDIQVYNPGTPAHLYIRTVCVQPDLSRLPRRAYGLRLLASLQKFILSLAKRGIEVKTISTRSETSDGIHLLQELHFPEVPSTTSNKNFVLDVEHSDLPVVLEYRRLLALGRAENKGE